jgi:transposase-like protein
MLKDDRAQKSYSENFKLKVLSEIESGRLTKREAIRIYGISNGAIYKWIRKYSKFELYNKRVRIETMDEKDRIKALEEENRKLKQILADKDVKLLVSDAMLEVLRKQMGLKSVAELKKKYNIDQ